MLLSIIIPVYNIENYIAECLESLFAQDLSDCEVIVINDGSTDKTYALLTEYEKKYHFKLICQKNQGLSVSRNNGVNVSTGQYLYFLDGDDYLKDFAVAEIKLKIEECKNVDVIYIDCIEASTGNRWNLISKDSPSMDIHDFPTFLDKSNEKIVPNMYSFIFAKEWWQKNDMAFEAGLKYEDALFMFKMLFSKGSIIMKHLDSPFYIYRIGRVGSIATALSMKNFTDRQYICRERYRLMHIHNNKSVTLCNIIYNSYIGYLTEALNTNLINKRQLFFGRKDALIMNKVSQTDYQCKISILAMINPKLMLYYIDGRIEPPIRKLINHLFTYSFKIRHILRK